MEGTKEARPRPPPPAASISSVLGDGDLLREILLRLGFPTYLVRFSLVSKWWLRHASDPAFLRRFRDRHPPALLIFYVHDCTHQFPWFVPVSQAPEHAADGPFAISDCRNGGLVLRFFRASSETYVLFSPLHQSGGMVLIPSPPRPISNRTFLPKDGGDDGDVAVDLFLLGRDLSVGMCTLKSGIWGVCTKISMELPEPEPTTIGDMLLPVNSKIYMATDTGFILVLDLVAASFSVLQLPDRVKTENFRLSCGEASGLFLIHADGYQLSVWHHETDGNGTCDWTLVYDAVCVHEACNRHEDVLVMGANGNAEFVLLALEASGVLICMQLSRTEKILYHEMDLRHVRGSCIVPFMMVWPPIFLTINQEE